jgi:mono/diheme cytochrome c family protein
MKNKTLLAITAFIALAGIAAMVVWLTVPGGELALRPNDKAVVVQGAEIYTAHCTSCHGAKLEGQPNWRQRLANDKLPAPPHDESGHTWHHSDTLLIDLTKHGPATVAGPDYKTDMPAYGDILSDAEIVAVLSYIKSTWPDKIRTRHDRMNRPRK